MLERGFRWRRLMAPAGPVLFGLGYVGLLLGVDVAVRLGSDDGGAALQGWASTNLDTLADGVLHPAAALVLSAFVGDESVGWWALFGFVGCWVTGRALGVPWAVAVGAAGQVVGTLLSEGLLRWRINRGDADPALRGILDIGPSYVVVALLVAGVVGGRRFERLPALGCFGLLVPYLFDGLTALDVTAVGHATAVLVGAAGGGAGILLSRRARQPAAASSVRR